MADENTPKIEGNTITDLTKDVDGVYLDQAVVIIEDVKGNADGIRIEGNVILSPPSHSE